MAKATVPQRLDYISTTEKINMFLEFNYDSYTNWLHKELKNQRGDPPSSCETLKILINMPLPEGCPLTESLLDYSIPRRRGHVSKSARLVKKDLNEALSVGNAMVISHRIYKYINRFRKLQGEGYDPLDIRLPL